MMRKPILGLFILLLWWLGTPAQGGDLVASVDRVRIGEGESLRLRLTAPGDAQGTPDLSALQQDFRITDRGQTTRMSIVNGQTSSTKEWQFTLFPKRTGHLRIPPIALGAWKSAPIAIEVLPSDQAARSGASPPVFLEAEVEPESPYVQEQVVYRVQIFSRVNLSQATLEDPQVEGAILERLGEDRSYETYRNGQRYQVIERRYVLFPQHSGTLTIRPPILSATIPDPQRRPSGFLGRSDVFDRFFGPDPLGDLGDLFGSRRPIQVQAPVRTLRVRPQPDGTASPWLPAKSLRLTDTWTPDAEVVSVGEPVTRTLTLSARGLTAAQLPDLQPPAPDGIRVYPDQPTANETQTGDDRSATKVIKQALVPTAAGEFLFPEVRLAWWDTETGRERVAVLPARHLRVRPGPETESPPPASVPSPEPRTDEKANPPPPAANPENARIGSVAWRALAAGPGLSLGLGLAWLLTLVLWWWDHRRCAHRPRLRKAAEGQPVSLNRARTQVRRACEAGDPRALRRALIRWAEACWPEPGEPGVVRLESLGRRLPELEPILGELDRQLYGAEAGSWEGRATWRRLKPILDQAPCRGALRGHSDRSPLPELYPETR